MAYLTQKPKVQLSQEDVRQCEEGAHRQYHASRDLGLKIGNATGNDGQHDMEEELIGKLGELAFCRYAKIYNEDTLNTFKRADIIIPEDHVLSKISRTWHIRATRYATGHLPIRPQIISEGAQIQREDPDGYYALITLNRRTNVATMAGYIHTSEGKHEDHWRTADQLGNTGHPTWWVNQEALHPFPITSIEEIF